MINDTIEEYKKNNSRMHILPTLITITLVLGIGIGALLTLAITSSRQTQNYQSNTSVTGAYDQGYIDSLLKTIKDKYINDVPSSGDLTHGIAKGIISSLGDKYTSFLSPDEAKAYNDAKDPSFEGIGVVLTFNEGNTEAETVLAGYPAEKAGLLTGDILLEVNGEKVDGKLPDEVATKIRGKAGTSVKVKVFRKSTTETKEFDITREKIAVSNISYKYEGDGVYRIIITQFIDKTPEDFNKAWDDNVNKIMTSTDKPKSIIMDLRNNPGGYVLSVRYVMDEFFKKETVLMMESQKGLDTVVYKDERTGSFENLPLVVLVNEGSASASEIFTAAVQDNGRGKVVGKPTVGKGVEQELLDNFNDGSLLILVFQKWLSPTGRQVTATEPIKPDFEVDFNLDEFKAGHDKQLEKALEVIKAPQ
ncbi:MAG: S41 family peptidase [Candidatus Dojkabacteria bacterium]